MDFIITVFLPLTLAIIMFSLGLGLTVGDFLNVARKPKAFTIGYLLQVIALPVVAYLIATNIGLSSELAFGLMILALCPGGPTSNLFSKLAHGDVALSVALTAIVSLTSIFTLPLFIAMFANAFANAEIPRIDVTSLTLTMVFVTAIPIALGMIVKSFFKHAAFLETVTTKIATGLIIVIIVSAVTANWGLFIENLGVIGPAVTLLLISMTILGTFVSQVAGLSASQTTSIAIETSIQNGTLGIAVGSLIVGNQAGLPGFSLPSALYGILMYAVVAPFVIWRRSIRN
ncbi:MAG: bile acid:sodium symporter family protein [Pseudomonadota bacterium]